MADTNNNFILEPCVLGGLCDGRKPNTEPAVVEGAPPVPMVVRNWVMNVDGSTADRTPLEIGTYPAPGADQVYQNAVVKVFFSKPVQGLDGRNFTLSDSRGSIVPAWVDQIGDGTWGLFPNQVQLRLGETYTARLKAGVCDLTGTCTKKDVVWKFVVTKDAGQGRGNTQIPMGFVASVPQNSSSSVESASHTRHNQPQVAENLDQSKSNRPSGH
jgi:hypothetical protein